MDAETGLGLQCWRVAVLGPAYWERDRAASDVTKK